jgi:hypothetical protein
MRHGRHAVKKLHDSADREHLRYKIDDLPIVGEQQWYVIPKDGQHRHIKQTHDYTARDGLLSPSA